MKQDDIENRVNQIIGIVAVKAGELNAVIDPLIDALARTEHQSFEKIRKIIGEDPDQVKFDLLEDAARRIATAEAATGGERYEDSALLGKLRSDLEAAAVDVARTERGSTGRKN